VTVSGVARLLLIGVLTWLGFPDTGRAEDEDIEVLIDPLALGQVEHEAAVEAAGGGHIQVLDGGREGEFRGLQTAFEAVVVAMGALHIDEQPKAILEGQIDVLGIVKLLFKRGAKSGQAKPGQIVEQWLS
jgi:hypothetical protein